MNRKITIGILLFALGGSLAVVGIAAADGDLLNGSVTEEVEPDGEIIVDGEFDQSGTSEVVVTAAEDITVNGSSGSSTTLNSGTEIFGPQDRTLNGTNAGNYPETDSVVVDVTGENITSGTSGTITQSSFNVTVSLRDAANSTLNSTTVSVSDPGLLAGLPGFGDGSESGRNLLIGGILALVGYLYLRDE